MSAFPTSRSELTGSFLAGRPEVSGGMVDLLLDAAGRSPGRVQLRWPGGSMTVAELAERARRWAAVFTARGILPGQRIAFVCGNEPDVIAMQFATYMCGAIEVPVNSELRGEMLRSILEDAEPAFVVAAEPFLEAVGGAVPPGVSTVALDGHLRREVSAAEPLVDPMRPGPSEVALILYTSGTTGPSKGVMLPHGYLPNMAATWISAVALTSTDVTYFPAPFFHVDAHVMNAMCLMADATFGFTGRFSVSRFWSESGEMGSTLFLGVGSMASALAARRPERDPSHSFRVALIAPITDDAFEYLEGDLGIVLLQLYGQTEADGVVFNTPDRRSRGGAGWACCGFDVRVVDDADEPLPVGSNGRILYRPREANMMTLGYWRAPAATAAASRNLWWHTGDLGHIDEDGFLWFDGRASDSLRRRGENISAWELERAIAAAPGLRSVAVVAVPDEIGGEDEIKAVISLEPGARWQPGEFFGYCAAHLPRFAQPRFIEIVRDEDFVRGPGTGAIQKHRLPGGADGVIDRKDFLP